jgi:hypothetical protein
MNRTVGRERSGENVNRGRCLLATVVSAVAALAMVAGAGPAVEDEHGLVFELAATWPEGAELPGRISNCVRCHTGIGGVYTDAVVHFAGSAHDRAGISCEDCHGGDTADDEFAHSRSGYIGTKPTELRERCASCHDEPAELYRESPHFSEGFDWRTPECWGCHADHATGSADRPVSAACTSCHGSRAEASTGEGESQILWKSRTRGAHGNRISVTMVADGESSPLELETGEGGDGFELVIRLETDGEGRVVSLAEDVIAAIQSDRSVFYILQVEEGDGYLGEGVVAPVKPFDLGGGEDFDAQLPAYAELVAALDRLRATRQRASELPKELDGGVAEVRRDAMAVVHPAPRAPSADRVENIVTRAGIMIERIEQTLGRAPEGTKDG